MQDNDGDTALHCAVNSNWHWSVRVLLEAGAKHDVKNNSDNMPLHAASGLGFTGYTMYNSAIILSLKLHCLFYLQCY